uniref:Heat shock protein 70 n=1 Tax=Panagrolaimus davidi TaxID=227884 RepID=A0A914Q274_9BILA
MADKTMESALLRNSNFFTSNIPLISTRSNDDKEVVGIDLGTSRCCAAVNRKNGITTIPLDNTGERLLPSFVSYDEESVKCGKVVFERLRNYSKSTVFDSKRIIGKKFGDIVIDLFWPYGLTEINGKVFIEIRKFNGNNEPLVNGLVSAEEVAADLLKHIKQKSDEFRGKKLTKAVITVPATFDIAQKIATTEAAKNAGWDEIILLPEPIAAAFAYFIDRPILNDSVVLDIDDFDPFQDGMISINRKEFEKMCEPLLNKVRNTLVAALYNSNLNANQINKVLLVGGGSRMPMIKILLQKTFPDSAHSCEENPDEVVAMGAAYYAQSIY